LSDFEDLSADAIAILELLASEGANAGDVARLEIAPGKWVEIKLTRRFRRYLASRRKRNH
jgi:hypothetical protein